MSRAASDATGKLSAELGGYELLVAGPGSVSSIPLPTEGELSIGRAEDADLRLPGNGISRRHALLRVRASDFTLQDLGSSNGTIVRGERVPARHEVSVTPGESLLVGDFVLVVRPRRSLGTTRHIWSHEYFEARVAEQCERCRDSGSPFHVLSISVGPQAPDDPARIVAMELPASHLLGSFSRGLFGVLLLDATESSAAALAARIERALREAGCTASAQVLAYPRDGTSASVLMGRLVGASDGDAAASSGSFILRSPVMVALHRQTDRVARSELSVLILGETGVGKDVLARSIHDRSERRDKPFLRLNCAALSENLLESELFGHEKGAFTGATHTKPGLLLAAAGGTVFLDEIGELPPRLQPKLLQVLETREILSVGSVKPRSIDVRFIAATNRDLEAEAVTGAFRSDLYYRLAAFTALVPPLRERREDILPLAQEFLRRARDKQRSQGTPGIRDEAAARLLDYAWPGNVRELRNVIERAVILSEGAPIGPEHLPLEKMRSVLLVAPRKPLPESDVGLDFLTPKERAERERILDALSASAGNQSKTAEKLGISRSTLLNRLDAYRLGRPRKRPG